MNSQNINATKAISPSYFVKGGSFFSFNFFRNLNIKSFLFYFFITILFVIISYLIYHYAFKNKTKFRANRERIEKDNNNTNNNEAELLFFYVDWCPHCKTAKPEWEQLKQEYEGKTINGYVVKFGEINCTNETAEVESLINKYNISGYPTIKLIKNGEVIEYDAKPTKATLDKFLNNVL